MGTTQTTTPSNVAALVAEAWQLVPLIEWETIDDPGAHLRRIACYGDTVTRFLARGDYASIRQGMLEALGRMFIECRWTLPATEEQALVTDAAPLAALVQRALERQVLEERARQDVQWGGASHDDEHEPSRWFDIAAYHCDRAQGIITQEPLDISALHVRCIKIAAILLAGLESFERRYGAVARTQARVPATEMQGRGEVRPQ